MSKQIKQMEMDSLAATFKDVRDLVILSVTGVNALVDNQIRLDLRKKNIRLQIVKNSLAKRVFNERLGLKIEQGWEGPTMVAWGGSSIADLSKEIDILLRKNNKFTPKGAVADGQQISFAQALKMPTRAEALGRIVMLALAPAGRIAAAVRGAASYVAGQVKAIGEKKEGAEAAPAA
jgi:large subunit ribosomal protein L10